MLVSLAARMLGVAAEAQMGVTWRICSRKLSMRTFINRFRKDEAGATMVEYGLLVGLIALVVALGATVLGQDISTMFNNIGTYIQSLVPPA